MKISLRMILPLVGLGLGFAAVPAHARNYDCSKAGNTNKTACKGAAAVTVPAPKALPASKPTPTRNYDCAKAGNANKAACRSIALAPATAAVAKAPAARNYDCTKAGNANKTVCKSAAAPMPAPPRAHTPIVPATRSVGPATGGRAVASPIAANGPKGATAKCRDGSYSLSKTHSGSCSRHGGVANWY